MSDMILEQIKGPEDIKPMSPEELEQLGTGDTGIFD